MSARTLAYAEVMRVGKRFASVNHGEPHSAALPSNTSLAKSRIIPTAAVASHTASRAPRSEDLFVCHLLVSLLPEACNHPKSPRAAEKEKLIPGKGSVHVVCACVSHGVI